MSAETVRRQARDKFMSVYRRRPAFAAFAPGRIEILGNHTDYNEGLVLSAAINAGTCFLVAPREDLSFRLTAGDLMKTVTGSVESFAPLPRDTWANYVTGVCHELSLRHKFTTGFDALFFGDIPLGAGLSSSAALEVSAVLALSEWLDIRLNRLEAARMAQAAEHKFAGVKCGLLDQITSLFGVAQRLVLTDFRSLKVQTLPFSGKVRLLMCNTHAGHALADGVYNERRSDCEMAAIRFDQLLNHPVRALRDVSRQEWERYHSLLDPRTARRSAHPIGETERVAEGIQRLLKEDLAGFGELMYASHASSQRYFENSSPELDFIVATAGGLAGVYGARLSGGGFGGGAVALVQAGKADDVARAMKTIYRDRFSTPCDVFILECEEGARLMNSSAD